MAEPGGVALRLPEAPEQGKPDRQEVIVDYVIACREDLIATLKRHLRDITPAEVRSLWGSAIYAWARTIVYGLDLTVS